MPRHQYKKPKLKADPLYKSLATTKLINYIMKDGGKQTAQRIVYKVFERLAEKGQDPEKVLSQAIDNVAPAFEVRSRRLGGASYLVPSEVRSTRRLFLALSWIIDAATSKSSKEFKTFENKLFAELTEAAANQGQAVNKKLQTEKLAEANKAFAHLRW